MKRHVIEMLVIDESGVMNRITGMFSRRGYNIDTITVGKTQKQGVSKIVFTLEADDETLYQVEKQCDKLLDVIEIRELPENSSFFREMCLAKFLVEKKDKEKIEGYVKKYGFEIISSGQNYIVIEMMAEPEKIGEFLKEMSNFKIEDISRTGITGISTR